MAQRTVHYLFGEMISRQINLADKKRFLLGSILPDAIDPSFRDTSHFKVVTETEKYLDFDAFRKKYMDLILRDDLYLGYYLHLVEDAFYRVYFYTDSFSMPRTREEVPILHNDYHILNSYIVNHYGIRNILENTVSLTNEPLFDLVPFQTETFLHQFANDFTENPEGSPVFLTQHMLDAFIKQYLPLAVEEVRNMKNGHSTLRTADYTWSRKR